MGTKWLANSLLFLAGVCFNVIIFVLVGYFIYIYAIKGYDYGMDLAVNLTEEKPSREVEFVLLEDTPIAEAARMLEEKGLIENAYLYRLELLLKDSSTYYKAGTYMLNQNMNHTDINVTLRQKSVEVIVEDRITIPEGYSMRDIATYLENKGYFSQEEFIYACNHHDFQFTFLRYIPERENRLEGYLFPNTYFVSNNPTPDEIINKMLQSFDSTYTELYHNRADELGMTMDEIITMASIIEKEVRLSEERPMVAEVMYNRMSSGMRLEMCSTVLYVLDKKRDRLLVEDLEVDSPYNTYLYTGLPHGPIANPGADCIRAALYPETGSNLFFVLEDDETGKHFFTDNYDAFLRAKERFNQIF